MRVHQMTFLSPPSIRRLLVVPTQDKVDFRAACFCHKTIVDIGFVCSVCLSSTSHINFGPPRSHGNRQCEQSSANPFPSALHVGTSIRFDDSLLRKARSNLLLAPPGCISEIVGSFSTKFPIKSLQRLNASRIGIGSSVTGATSRAPSVPASSLGVRPPLAGAGTGLSSASPNTGGTPRPNANPNALPSASSLRVNGSGTPTTANGSG